MQAYLKEFMKNTALYKDQFGGALFGEQSGSGCMGTGMRRKSRRGRGLLLETNDNEGPMESNSMTGAGRMRRSKSSFDIGKYSKAVANGYTKEQAKQMARR